MAVASVHPHELTYFNALAGGPRGGRHILSDSNLDWGQGLKGLARLQRSEPEYRDLTLYYFGDTDPAHYGVRGTASWSTPSTTRAGCLICPRCRLATSRSPHRFSGDRGDRPGSFAI